MRDIVAELIGRSVPLAPRLGDWDFLSSSPAGKAQRYHTFEVGTAVEFAA